MRDVLLNQFSWPEPYNSSYKSAEATPPYSIMNAFQAFLAAEQLEQCRRMAEEGASKQQIARVLSCSPSTVKKALASLEAGMELQC